MTDRATIDFETRSACDLRSRGAWLYSRDPTTEVLCLSYILPGDDPNNPKLWHAAHPAVGIEASPLPKDLFAWIKKGGLLEAHNAFFEMCVWQNVSHLRDGWPAVKLEQWRCTAARAAALSLPRSLDGAVGALALPIKKSAEGRALIRRYCIPKRRTKADPDTMWNEDEGLADLWEYCRQDIRAEYALSLAVPDLIPIEQKVWFITQDMNLRGVKVDVELCHAALLMASATRKKLNVRLKKLTKIESGTLRNRVKVWLNSVANFPIPNMQSKTIQRCLDQPDLPKIIRQVLHIVQQVNRTSTSKFKRILESVDEDERIRELLIYCGAERTGRFAGRGVQVQNLPKGRFGKGVTMESAVADIKSGDLEHCEKVHGDVMNLLVSVLRGTLIAPDGRDFLTADYAAIEARCVLWEAGAIEALKVFLRGEDIYCDMATSLFGHTVTKANAKQITMLGHTERDLGKVAVLGLGYGMGFVKFLLTLRTYGIRLTREQIVEMIGEKVLKSYEHTVRVKLLPRPTDFDQLQDYKQAARDALPNLRRLKAEQEDPVQVLHELALCLFTVQTYRGRYEEVPAMHKAQEDAAMEAVRSGTPVKCGVVTWRMDGRFLKCVLPSGRALHYCDPEIRMLKTAWGARKPALTFMGIAQITKDWERQATYGGKIVENITQAIARDIMAYAMVTLAADPVYDLLITVHDEIVSEVDEGTGDAREFEKIMADLPAAYDGCPITAEAKRFKRYRK